MPLPATQRATSRRKDAVLRACFRFPSNIKLHTSNISHGSVQLSLRPHFDHFGLGHDADLAGVGEMLQARSSRLYWVHAVWVPNLFLYLVVVWWIFYRWRNQQPWTFFLFIFVLISPTILYQACLLLFPPESAPDEFVDYKTHY